MTSEVQHSAAASEKKKHYPRYSPLPDTLQGQSPENLQALFEETDGLPPDERLEILQLREMTPAQCRIWELGSDFRGRLRYAVSIGWTAEDMWTTGGMKLPTGIERAGTVRPRSALPAERRHETTGKPAQPPKEPEKPSAGIPPQETAEQPADAAKGEPKKPRKRRRREGAPPSTVDSATPPPKKPRGRPPGSGKKKKEPDQPPTTPAPAEPGPAHAPAAAKTPPAAAEASKPGIENLSLAAQFLVVRLLSECCFEENSKNACAFVPLDDRTYIRLLLEYGDAPIAYPDLFAATKFIRVVFPDSIRLVQAKIRQWYAARTSLVRDSFQAYVVQAIAYAESDAARAETKG